MRRALARHNDPARVTGSIEPFEGEAWRVVVKEADTEFAGSIGGSFRTGRGMLDKGTRYTVLMRKSGRVVRVVMSDTPDELRDLLPIIIHAKGRVLVNGLGLGCVVRALLANPDVEHIDVVEIDTEIIERIGPYYEGERCTIHQGDAFTYQWPKGTRWDCVWHDVWNELSVDNLSEANGHARPGSYEKLHRRYGRRCDWQGSWGKEFLERERGGLY